MKTLLFTLEYPPFKGGVSNYYGNLVKYWPDKISVLDNGRGQLINGSLPFLNWLPAIFALKKAIKKSGVEHVIVGQILPLGTAAWVCSKILKIKYSVIIHGMDFSYALRFWRKRFTARLILNRADKIIVSNSHTAKEIKRFLGDLTKDKIVMVNPGADESAAVNVQSINRLKNKYNLQNNIILLSVGRLVKRKGFDLVDAAMPEILKQIPNLAYVIVGNEAELKNSDFKNAVIINKASDQERNIWYQAADIFIMPSRNINGDYEGFGIVYLEANLAGKPVIAGESGGISDAVIDGLNGLIINPENIEEIVRTVIRLAQNQSIRKKMGERGRERALREFSWQKQIDKIYKAIV